MEIKRYIPELQTLCAKQIASLCRSMSQCERYIFLKKIPKHIQELIRSFPIDFIEWCCDGYLLNIKIIKHYIDHKKDRKYITESYKKDCEKGITCRKVLWRKCQNMYCDDSVLQKVYQSPEDIYWGLCKKCEDYRIPHFKLMKMYLQIKNKQKIL